MSKYSSVSLCQLWQLQMQKKNYVWDQMLENILIKIFVQDTEEAALCWRGKDGCVGLGLRWLPHHQAPVTGLTDSNTVDKEQHQGQVFQQQWSCCCWQPGTVRCCCCSYDTVATSQHAVDTEIHGQTGDHWQLGPVQCCRSHQVSHYTNYYLFI